MTSLIASPRRELPRKLPSLPVIEHPALRRPENSHDLQVRGSSRQDGEIAILPPLRSRARSQGHSRVLTWPLEQEKGGTNTGLEIPPHKQTPEQLEELIREKLVARINGVRQAFRSNDPMGKGNVSREALVTILYHLCGYLSPDQINALLKRLGFDTQSAISFEDFVRHFRDDKLLTKEWVDPVLRPTIDPNDPANLPANRIRKRHRDIAMEQKHAALKEGRRHTPPKYFSALEVFPQLKIRAQQGTLPYQKIFPPSIFDVDGMVLKPQLRTALQLLGYQMFEEEFEKVWDRFDSTGLGTVDSLIFFRKLGLNPLHEHQKKVQRSSPLNAEKEVDICEDKNEPVAEKDKPNSGPQHNMDETAEVTETENIMSLLSAKFKEGYRRITNSCAKYDQECTGQISKADFRKVLSEYHLQLGPVETEHFLQRCGMRDQSMVAYRKVMDMYLDRSEHGRLQTVLDDSKHRFNRSRDSAIGNTTALDAEARLLDLLQSDFLSLLGAFRQFDRDDLGYIKRYQFKELLEARLKIKLSNEDLSSILHPMLEDSKNGLVPYARFLELFSSPRENHDKLSSDKMSTSQGGARASTAELNSSRSVATKKSLSRCATPIDLKKNKSEARNVHLLFSSIREILTDKFQAINKSFLGMDQIKKGYLSKEMLPRLFERYQLKLTASEADLVWSKLPVEKDGTLSFMEFVQYCFQNFNTASSVVKDGSGTLSRLLQECARSLMRKGLESVPEESGEVETYPVPLSLNAQETDGSPKRSAHSEDVEASDKGTVKSSVESLLKRIKKEVCSQWSEMRDAFIAEDKDGNATLSFNDAKVVMKNFCRNLKDHEFDIIFFKFDKRKNGRMWYLEFLKYFLPTMPVKIQDLVPCPRSHKTGVQVAWSESERGLEVIKRIVRKIRNQMISDWKDLRRSFKKVDLTGDGFVPITDFKTAMKNFGFPLNEEDLYHLFSVFDENMTGRISYENFMKRCLSTD